MSLTTFVPPAGSTPESSAGGTHQLAPLRLTLLGAILDKYKSAPRSVQTAIGPSQAGHPCKRYLAFMASGRPRAEQHTDPWPSILGTAGHAWLAEAIEAQPGWLSEQRVHIGPGLSGSADAFRISDRAVVDFKILGNTGFTEIRSHPADDPYWTDGDGRQYYRQIQCYGRGFANAGHAVEWVVLAIFGRSKRLSEMFLVAFPYRPEVSDEVLADLAAARMLAAVGIDPMVIPASASKKSCYYCPFRGPETAGLCESGDN